MITPLKPGEIKIITEEDANIYFLYRAGSRSTINLQRLSLQMQLEVNLDEAKAAEAEKEARRSAS